MEGLEPIGRDERIEVFHVSWAFDCASTLEVADYRFMVAPQVQVVCCCARLPRRLGTEALPDIVHGCRAFYVPGLGLWPTRVSLQASIEATHSGLRPPCAPHVKR